MTNAQFQSTPSVGRETFVAIYGRLKAVISIHSLRGEGDNKEEITMLTINDFNPLPPWGGRLMAINRDLFDMKFLSTTSLGGGTRK